MAFRDMSAAEKIPYLKALSSNYTMQPIIQLLDRNGNYLDDLSDQFVEGQVTVDASADIVYTATVTITDILGNLHMDTNTPFDGAITRDRMVKIICSIQYWDGTAYRFNDEPVFYGFVTGLSRPSPSLLKMELSGKEQDLLDIAYRSAVYRKGTLVTDVMKDIAADRGENKFDFPVASKGSWDEKLVADYSLGADAKPWSAIKGLRKPDTFVFYNARGYLEYRSIASSAVKHTFSTGQGGNITSLPVIGYDVLEAKNTVRVIGATPKGKGAKPFRADLSLPASHPNSPVALARNGKPAYKVHTLTDDKIKSTKAAQAAAKNSLAAVSLQSINVTFEAAPMYHVEPNDICLVKTPESAYTFRIKQFTIPLVGGNVMGIGTLKNVNANKSVIR